MTTIGLNFQQLVEVFGKSFSARYDEVVVEHLTAEVGINPITKRELERISNQYHIPEEYTLLFSLFVMAFADVIVRNNEAITRAIFPSVGS